MPFDKFYRAAMMLFVSGAFLLGSGGGIDGFAQSKPQRPDAPTGTQKRNQRPAPQTEEERKRAEAEKKRLEEEKNAIVDTEVLKLDTSVVNVDAVVYNKKSGQIVTGL